MANFANNEADAEIDDGVDDDVNNEAEAGIDDGVGDGANIDDGVEGEVTHDQAPPTGGRVVTCSTSGLAAPPPPTLRRLPLHLPPRKIASFARARRIIKRKTRHGVDEEANIDDGVELR